MSPVLYGVVMPKSASPKYPTTNWAEYNAALKKRGSLDIWFDPDTVLLSALCGPPRRPARFLGQCDRTVPDAEGAVQAAAATGDGVGGEFAQTG